MFSKTACFQPAYGQNLPWPVYFLKFTARDDSRLGTSDKHPSFTVHHNITVLNQFLLPVLPLQLSPSGFDTTHRRLPCSGSSGKTSLSRFTISFIRMTRNREYLNPAEQLFLKILTVVSCVSKPVRDSSPEKSSPSQYNSSFHKLLVACVFN